MDFSTPVALGRTGLQVGRLGISSSYGAPCEAFEEAFARGCNYFTWGTFIRGRSPAMAQAIRRIVARGERDRLVLAMWSYAHSAWLMGPLLRRGLRALGIQQTDVLLLGYFPRRPAARLLRAARRLQDAGLVRHLGLSSHRRALFPQLAHTGEFDVFHVRYNAAHRGAEDEVFAHLGAPEQRPGVVSFTATRWGQLLEPKRMPPGEAPPDAATCYRFVLSRTEVDVCMMGARSLEQMQQNLRVLDAGPLSAAELARLRRVGDYVHG